MIKCYNCNKDNNLIKFDTISVCQDCYKTKIIDKGLEHKDKKLIEFSFIFNRSFNIIEFPK